MFSGTKFKLGEEEYIVPALTLGQLRSGALNIMQEHDKLFAEGKTFEVLYIRGKVILVALQRNYPEMTEDKLFTLLDMANTTPMWNAVLGLSGFTMGEGQAATTETSGT